MSNDRVRAHGFWQWRASCKEDFCFEAAQGSGFFVVLPPVRAGLDLEGLKSTVDCLKRHGLEPVAALALPHEVNEVQVQA